jgi:copper resistance protein B
MTTREWLRPALAAVGLALALTAGVDAQGAPGESAAPGVSPGQLPSFIPTPTEEDRKAAFPDVEGHAAHDQSVHYFVLLDQLEWQAANDAGGINLDGKGWIGRDRDRLWFRTEGDGEADRVEAAQAHVLYGRQIARWWDVVGGIRQDFRPGPAQTWAVLGIQGLAPYWFELEATAYVGASGRTHARLEVEYELLLTNRLVLQPLVEVEIFGKSDPERGVGAGLSTTDIGFRLRHELRREVAPYVGVVWSNKWGKTADFARAGGDDANGARLVAGLRLWF